MSTRDDIETILTVAATVLGAAATAAASPWVVVPLTALAAGARGAVTVLSKPPGTPQHLTRLSSADALLQAALDEHRRQIATDREVYGP